MPLPTHTAGSQKKRKKATVPTMALAGRAGGDTVGKSFSKVF